MPHSVFLHPAFVCIRDYRCSSLKLVYMCSKSVKMILKCVAIQLAQMELYLQA